MGGACAAVLGGGAALGAAGGFLGYWRRDTALAADRAGFDAEEPILSPGIYIR